MSYSSSIFVLALIGSAASLSDVFKSCLEANNEPLSNDKLSGIWYEIYRFSLFSNLVPQSACMELNFTRPTTEELQAYREAYNSVGLPYSFDDDTIIRRRDRFPGMLVGNNHAKFFVLAPGSAVSLFDGYGVFAFRPLNENFMMFWDCSMRGNVRWLLTRNRDATVEEMEQLIRNTPELNRLDQERFCAK